MNFTRQQLFDKAYTAIVKQGVPSYRAATETKGGGCVYRGPNGTSCAIGHLLSDELRATVAEAPIDGLLELDSNVFDFFGVTPQSFREDAEFLSRLQHAHDVAILGQQDLDGFADRFKRNMAALAQEHGLTVPEVA